MFSRKRRPVRIYLYLDPLGQIIHDSVDDAIKEALANSTGEDTGEWSLTRLWGKGEKLVGTFEQGNRGIVLSKR